MGMRPFSGLMFGGKGSKSFLEEIVMSIPVSMLSQKVSDLVTEAGQWDFEGLHPILGNGIQRLFSEVVPRPILGGDHIRWLAKGDGEFSIKSAYSMIVKIGPTNSIYKAIWKLKVPKRVRIFIWKL